MSNLAQAFQKGEQENRALLIGYVSAGYPTVEKSIQIAQAMIKGGVDVLEVGVPYSDPVMDGPVIQRASEISLNNGTRTADVFKVVKAISNLVPALVMTYWNPVEKYQTNKFAQALTEAGGIGLITPDLTVEESAPWIDISNQLELARVYVLAQSSTDERIIKVAQESSGFIYAASLMGVTGTRNSVSSGAQTLVERIRSHSNLPVAVGLGVSNKAQAAEVAKYANAVIVGSAFIKIIQEESDFNIALQQVENLAKDLRSGLSK